MVFVYIRIYFAAKARARRGIRKQPRPRTQPEEKCTSFTTAAGSADASKQMRAGTNEPGTVDRNSNSPMRNVVVEGGVTLEHGGIATIVTEPPQPMAIPIVTCDFASDISTSDNADNTGDDGPGGGYLAPPKDTLKVISSSSMTSKSPLTSCQFRGSTLSVNGDLAQQAAAMARCRAPSVGIDTDMVSEFDPSSSDSGVVSRCAVVKPLKLRLCQPIFGRRAASKSKRETVDVGKHPPSQHGSETNIVEVPRVQKPRDPEREKRRIARKKEKRATLILGLIMGSFIACWLPFFFLYILTPICPVCDIPARAFAIAFWLGYMNSALNPVIYTIFNKDFRRAFRRILFK
ncbi:alpha-2B adrenergic receptor-like [Anabrus simplex]|uniref:alpha-2B adrenergic receptor-like n=1 Tax=Anabrus simplex TaxID=316456 RepID=UPI0034DD9048